MALCWGRAKTKDTVRGHATDERACNRLNTRHFTRKVPCHTSATSLLVNLSCDVFVSQWLRVSTYIGSNSDDDWLYSFVDLQWFYFDSSTGKLFSSQVDHLQPFSTFLQWDSCFKNWGNFKLLSQSHLLGLYGISQEHTSPEQTTFFNVKSWNNSWHRVTDWLPKRVTDWLSLSNLESGKYLCAVFTWLWILSQSYCISLQFPIISSEKGRSLFCNPGLHRATQEAAQADQSLITLFFKSLFFFICQCVFNQPYLFLCRRLWDGQWLYLCPLLKSSCSKMIFFPFVKMHFSLKNQLSYVPSSKLFRNRDVSTLDQDVLYPYNPLPSFPACHLTLPITCIFNRKLKASRKALRLYNSYTPCPSLRPANVDKSEPLAELQLLQIRRCQVVILRLKLCQCEIALASFERKNNNKECSIIKARSVCKP